MIDTIVITLKKGAFKISDPDKFKPSARWALSQSPSHYGIQSKQTPTKSDLKKGIYKPRLTLANYHTRQGVPELTLKIELSLPKLLFGNNFEELSYKDFSTLLIKLEAQLQTMGIITTAAELSRAPVSAIHYSKNFALTDGSTPYHYIAKIRDANLPFSLDVNKTDYRNDGHSYKWHCNSYEIIFYDKVRDLEQAKKSEKRAIEKDCAMQLHLLDTITKKKKLDVLRMEVRLNKRQKIKTLFQSLGIKSDFSFKKLFKPAISKRILLHYLEKLERKRPLLLDYQSSGDKALLAELLFNNPELKPKQVVQLFGLKKLLEVMNPRELKMLFPKERGWTKLLEEASNVKFSFSHHPFEGIKKSLIQFKRIRFN